MESCGAEKEFGVLVDAGERGSARCPCCKRVLVSWVWGQSQARSRGAQGQDERQRAQTEAQEVPSEHWEAPVGCAGCPERSWSLHPQRYPKAACETCSGRPCLSGGLDQVTPRGPCHPQPLGDCDSPQSWAAFTLLPLAWAHPTPAPGAASQTSSGFSGRRSSLPATAGAAVSLLRSHWQRGQSIAGGFAMGQDLL